MNIIVITRSSWSNNNSIGNTMTNFFKGFPLNCKFYNIYYRTDTPINDICVNSLSISELSIIKSFFNKSEAGKIVYPNSGGLKESSVALEKNIYRHSSATSGYLLKFLREIIWLTPNWKKHTKEYVESVSPDVIFMPVFGCYYPHRVLKYIKSISNAKVVIFHADDNYTMRQFSLNPLFWLYRVGLRRWVKRTVDIADTQYGISEIQCEEYKGCFNKNCKLITKGYNFNIKMPVNDSNNTEMTFVYTGNVNVGRWRSLAILGEALDWACSKGYKAHLDIYSGTVLTKSMKKAFDKHHSIIFHGSVSAKRVKLLQSNADVLVYVESMNLKNRLEVHQSFSTKIVDYMYSGNCILAIGTSDEASIAHMIKHKCAQVITNQNETKEKVLKLIKNSDLRKSLALSAWNTGKEYHNITKIQMELLHSFK